MNDNADDFIGSQMRKKFEAWISAMPYERMISRWPTTGVHTWPGQYKDILVQTAWEAWQESGRGLMLRCRSLEDDVYRMMPGRRHKETG